MAIQGVHSPAGGTPALDLTQLWDDLIQGRVRIIESFSSEERSYLALSLCPSDSRRPPEAYFRLLERVLGGVPQKAVAIEFDVAASTVAAACRQCLAYMGLTCLPSKVPPLLCLFAHAARQPSLAADARVCDVEHPAGPFRTLAAPRLERGIRRRFSPAQSEVLSMLLDGKSYAEIARQRGTSPRTIANQVAAVMGTMRVSGRTGIISELIQCSQRQLADSSRELSPA